MSGICGPVSFQPEHPAENFVLQKMPLLDHPIAVFAMNLAPHMKRNGSRPNSILRNAVKEHGAAVGVPDVAS